MLAYFRLMNFATAAPPMPIASNERLAGSGTLTATWAKALPDIPINTAAVPKANNDNERMVILPLSQNSPRKYFQQHLCHRFISTTY
ncbi:MAG: hypothetical protein WB611_00970 [Stellaceae bacterium]